MIPSTPTARRADAPQPALIWQVILAFCLAIIGMTRSDTRDPSLDGSYEESEESPVRRLLRGGGGGNDNHETHSYADRSMISTASMMPFWAVYGEFDIDELQSAAPYSAPIMCTPPACPVRPRASPVRPPYYLRAPCARPVLVSSGVLISLRVDACARHSALRPMYAHRRAACDAP